PYTTLFRSRDTKPRRRHRGGFTPPRGGTFGGGNKNSSIFQYLVRRARLRLLARPYVVVPEGACGISRYLRTPVLDVCLGRYSGACDSCDFWGGRVFRKVWRDVTTRV